MTGLEAIKNASNDPGSWRDRRRLPDPGHHGTAGGPSSPEDRAVAPSMFATPDPVSILGEIGHHRGEVLDRIHRRAGLLWQRRRLWRVVSTCPTLALPPGIPTPRGHSVSPCNSAKCTRSCSSTALRSTRTSLDIPAPDLQTTVVGLKKAPADVSLIAHPTSSEPLARRWNGASRPLADGGHTAGRDRAACDGIGRDASVRQGADKLHGPRILDRPRRKGEISRIIYRGTRSTLSCA